MRLRYGDGMRPSSRKMNCSGPTNERNDGGVVPRRQGLAAGRISVRGQQQTRLAAHGAVAIGTQLEALAAEAAAPIIPLVSKMIQVELGVLLRGGGLGTSWPPLSSKTSWLWPAQPCSALFKPLYVAALQWPPASVPMPCHRMLLTYDLCRTLRCFVQIARCIDRHHLDGVSVHAAGIVDPAQV